MKKIKRPKQWSDDIAARIMYAIIWGKPAPKNWSKARIESLI